MRVDGANLLGEATGRGSGTAGGARLWARIRLGLICLPLLLAAACSNIDVSGVQPASVGSPPAGAPPTTGGNPAAAERHRLVELFGGEYSAPTTERYLNEVLSRLAPATQTPSETYRVTILNSPIVNAFALPSGDIFVTRGLLALANDTSEIAAVMAHEIAHVTAQHAAKRAEKEKTARLFALVSTAVLDQPEEAQEQEARGRLGLAQFSRQQEFEADQIGIKTIGQAGYDAFAASRFLGSLGRWTTMRASLLVRKRQCRQARHDVDASLDARAHRPGGGGGAPGRRARRRRGRPRPLSHRDRRPRLWRRSRRRPRARPALRPSQARLRLRGARRLRA